MVERNLAKVEVESSRLFSRSRSKIRKHDKLPFLLDSLVATERQIFTEITNPRRDSKEVMQRPAKPFRSVRFRFPPPEQTIREYLECLCSNAWKRARVVKLVDTSDLKSAAFVNNGRAGSIPASGTSGNLHAVSSRFA